MTKRFGFTLAEVLITLGIIGVVAAMTMPTLINQTNGAQYKAAYKKALSAIAQGVTLNVALDDVSFADVKAGTAAAITPNADGTASIASLLNSRMNVVNHSAKPTGYTYAGGNSTLTEPADATYLFFNDGSMFAFKGTDAGCTSTAVCQGYIDVNGLKGPNKVVTCDTATATAKDTITNGAITAQAAACDVKSPTDIYPVVFYDQTIQPLTNAGKAVLYGK